MTIVPQLTGTDSMTLPASPYPVNVNGIRLHRHQQRRRHLDILPDDTILAIDALPDGTYDVAVSAVDIYGNVGIDADRR